MTTTNTAPMNLFVQAGFICRRMHDKDNGPGIPIFELTRTCGKEAEYQAAQRQINDALAAWNKRAATAPAPAAVPSGWRLVPEEPTREMMAAASQYESKCAVLNYGAAPDAEGLYGAMIDAAPPAPSASPAASTEALTEAAAVAALKEVMEWISNWAPSFIFDDEWPATKAKVEEALAAARAASPAAESVLTDDIIRAALQEAWNDYCDDAQAFPDCFRIERGPKLFADFSRCSNFILSVRLSLEAALRGRGEG